MNQQPSREDQILCDAIMKVSPQPRWAVVVGADGILHGSFNLTNIKDNRSAEMVSTLLAHSARLTSELQNGFLRETLTVGTTGAFLIVAVGEEMILAANFDPISSWDDLRQQLHEAAQEIERVLNESA